MDFVKIPTKQKKHDFVPANELRGNQLRDFVFAGNSLFTVANEESGNHVTFKVKKHKEKELWFVTTRDVHSFEFIGTCFENKKYVHSKKSVLEFTDTKVKVFYWFLTKFFHNQEKYPMVKVYHHGRCGACNKKLTTPESIKSGIGPVCGGRRR